MSNDSSDVRARLEAQRADLAGRIARLQANERHETEHSGDVAGETDNAHEWENAERREGQINEALNELKQTEDALARLNEGAYGVCTVKKNKINNNTGQGVRYGDGTNVYSGGQIKNNKIKENGGYGIVIRNSQDGCHVADNKVYANTGIGINKELFGNMSGISQRLSPNHTVHSYGGRTGHSTDLGGGITTHRGPAFRSAPTTSRRVSPTPVIPSEIRRSSRPTHRRRR